MDELLNYFGEYHGLTPELFIKYIVFIVALASVIRVLGELLRSIR